MEKIKQVIREKKPVSGFIEFIREQGVFGLAIGFILGGAITKVVTSLVNDIINPLLGLLIGAAGKLSNQYVMIGSAKVQWGNFVNTMVNFLIIALVVYVGTKLLGLQKLDKKKEAK